MGLISCQRSPGARKALGAGGWATGAPPRPALVARSFWGGAIDRSFQREIASSVSESSMFARSSPWLALSEKCWMRREYRVATEPHRG